MRLIRALAAVILLFSSASRAAVLTHNTFNLGREGWQVYDYNGLPYPQTGGTNVFYPATWHSSGGLTNSGYISGDDSMWRIDVPESPNSVLCFILYQSWVGGSPLDLRNKVLSLYLRGDNLDLKGASVYFWALSNRAPAGGTRWHFTAHPLSVANGNWGPRQSVQLTNDESFWHLSWSYTPSNPTSLDRVLESVDSFGISFVGFPAGDEPTGTFSMDEFSITSTNTNSASPLILFRDDFQSDAAGVTSSVDDLDPVIGSGDIGGFWSVPEYGANYLQVLNDTTPGPPGSNVPGTNNYVSLVRTTSIGRGAGLYATGWAVADTLSNVVQLDFDLWQNGTGSDLGVVFLSQAPPSGPASFTFSNSSVWTDTTLNEAAWHSVRFRANFDNSLTQFGIPPQHYTLSLDGGAPTTGSFYAPHNDVQTIGVYGGANNQTIYLDNVDIRVLSGTFTLGIAPLPDRNQELTLTGNPDFVYAVETSTNLTNWTSISTNTADGVWGRFVYQDLTATNFQKRFYRGRWQ